MSSRLHKLRALFLCFLVSLSLLSGCSSAGQTPSSALTPTQGGTPSVSSVPDTSPASGFSSFLDNLFRQYAAADSLSLHYIINNPEAMQITMPPVSLGRFSVEELKKSSISAKENLHLLSSFSRDSLEPFEQLTYDLLKYSFETSILPEGTELYDTPLGPVTGLQTQLPILLAEYRFSSSADVEDYFLLLEDLPNYFSDLCEFERQRSAAKTQSCAEVLSRIILQCKAFIENPEENFLIAGFRDRLTVLPDLTAAQTAELCVRNQTLVFTKVIPAYELLIETLEELSDPSVSESGLGALPNGAAYYEYLVRSTTGSGRSIEELEEMLETTLFNSLLTMVTLYDDVHLRAELEKCQKEGLSVLSNGASQDGSAAKRADATSADALLSALREQLLVDFPSPAQASCRVQSVHPSLEDFISPALYLVPPLDGYTENVIYINQAKSSLEGLFSTLAHEGYPGHLYQNTYFAASSPHPVRMLLNFTGYDEGWATYAEMYAYRYADCSEELRRFLISEQLAGLCLYSLSDIRIHYRNESRESVLSFLQGYGLSDEGATELYYMQLAEPAIYLPYAVGYLEFSSLLEEYLSLKGNGAPLLLFHTFLLETGPAPFPILKEHLLTEFR
ncbi:MAG: DUF885 domain-containing protein [Lachnospiraceae bacterium]|nr:DUF885 domain-containing protein [Lachnospiraceae bacterium]